MLCFAACIVHTTVLAQSIAMPLTGNQVEWQFKKATDSTWYPATTPGTIHTDLMSNDLIPDPFYRDNENKVQWVENEDWEYRTFFKMPTAFSRQKNFELRFDGLDTYAAVYLNDSLILQADNMFRIFRINLPAHLLRDNNQLLVHFFSAAKRGNQRAAQLAYPLAGDVDGRAFTRKAQYQYGWDWGPRLLTCGIWKNIYLTAWSKFKLDRASIFQDSLTDDTAYLTLNASIMSDIDTLIDFTFSAKQGNLKSTLPIALHKGMNEIALPAKIAQPVRWWCHGLGDPFLYEFYLSAGTDSGNIIYHTRFGIRSIELLQQKDSIGSGFCFVLNGVPVFVKGANYIPPDNFLPRITRDDYEKITQSALLANMNMLRVWGGGVYADDAFYDWCDEKGILVWQDFMFAGAMVPGDSAFAENVRREAIDQTTRLCNHPCIALWCGNNEIDEAWHNWGWQEQYHYSLQNEEKIWDDYQNIFTKIIPGVLRKYDPHRPYIASSPSIGWGHKESLQQGDSHYWGVWWGHETFETYAEKVGRFMSEYGFQAMPSLSSFKDFTAPGDLTYNVSGKNKFSEILTLHQKHPTGFETIDEYLQRDYHVPKDFEKYVYVSQLVQRDGIATAITAHRRAKPYCWGTLYWQLNDCWPVVSWSSVDYYVNPKALQFAVSKLYKTFLVSVIEKEEAYEVFLVSDSMADAAGVLHLDLFKFDGTTIKSLDKTVTARANESTLVFTLDKKKMVKQFDPRQSVLYATFTIAGNETAGSHFFFTKPKELLLQKPVIRHAIFSLPDSSGNLDFPFQYSVELATNAFAKDIFVSGDNEDVRLSENFFDLLPGEKKTLILFTKTPITPSTFPIKIISLADSY